MPTWVSKSLISESYAVWTIPAHSLRIAHPRSTCVRNPQMDNPYSGHDKCCLWSLEPQYWCSIWVKGKVQQEWMRKIRIRKINFSFLKLVLKVKEVFILPYNRHTCCIILVQEYGFTIQDENTNGLHSSTFSVTRPLPSAHMASKTY